jgi:YidC/Oxa1 family membrane protein insertase
MPSRPFKNTGSSKPSGKVYGASCAATPSPTAASITPKAEDGMNGSDFNSPNGGGLDKRSMIAFAVIGLLALFMSTDIYRGWVGIPTSAEQAQIDEVQAQQAALEAEAQLDEQTEPSGSRSGTTLADASSQADSPEREPGTLHASTTPLTPAQPFSEIASSESEEALRIETDLFIAFINPVGATLERYELKNFKSYYGETVLLFDDGTKNLAPSFNLDGRLITTDALPYTLTEDLTTDEGRSLRFRYTNEDGSFIEKSYLFVHDTYRVDVAVLVDDLQATLRHHTWGIGWDSGILLTEASAMQDNMYTEGLAFVGSNVEGFRLGRKDETGEERRKGDVHWASARNKYFEVALVPLSEPAEQVIFEGWQSQVGEKDAHSAYAFDLEMPLSRGNLIDASFALYMGPLQKSAMKAMPESLEQSVMTKTALGFMGFMWALIRPFANIVLWVFGMLHNYIDNFGVIIIVFSFLVKAVVWPLTHKSYQSMKEMQNIRPLQDEIKKKYANDPKKQQEATMALFKEHKVNPFGSCLPNLIQMPLLFSLYFVFRGAIDLRGAEFVFWINDLAVPDALFQLPFTLPLYGSHVAVLPFIFAISSFLMMRMTMTDPNQKMMLYAMPVMMMLIFNQLPSGLTLYYTIFNLLSAAQQHWSKGMLEKSSAGPVPTMTHAVKKHSKTSKKKK